MNVLRFKNIVRKIIQSKFFSPVFLMVIITIYIYIEFNPLFSTIPGLNRYLSYDFDKSFPYINHLLESFDLKHLRFFHWDQFASAGSPSLVDIGTYYLPNYLLKPIFKLRGNFVSLRIYELFTLSHYLLAGLGFFLFIKPKVKTVWLAIFGALFFIASSNMVNLYWQLYVFAIALLPWILITLEKYFSSKKLFWLFLAAFISFQQLAVCPQFFMYSMIFIAGYFLVQKFNFPTFKSLFLYYFLVVAYSAIFLLPLIEFNRLAPRLNYLNYDFIDTGSNKMSDISQLVLNASHQRDSFIYLGGIAISLVIIFLYQTKSKIDWSLLAIAIFFYFLGSNSSLFQSIMGLVPGLSSMRFHSRANEIVVFVLIILLIKAINSYRFNLKRDLIITGIVAVFIIFSYLIGAKFNADTLEQLYYSLILLSLFALILVARSKGLFSSRVIMITVCVLIFFDLARIVRYTQDLQQYNFQLTPTGQIARSEWFWGPNPIDTTDNESRIPTNNFYAPDYNKFLINHNYAAGSYSAAGGDKTPAAIKRYDDYLTAAKVNPNLLRLANINTPLGYLPRAFILSCYKVESNDDRLLTNLRDKNFTGEEFIYLSQPPQNINENNQNCQSKLIPVLTIQDQDKIVLSTINNQQPVVLFISDNWYPGWNVYVNGKKSQVIRADYTFKAVALASGQNQVVFKYEPKSFKIGGLITWLALIASLFLAGYQFIVQKRKKLLTK